MNKNIILIGLLIIICCIFNYKKTTNKKFKITLLKDFVNDDEINHLIKIGTDLFKKSTVIGKNEKSIIYLNIRTSETAFLPTNDLIVSNIMDRVCNICNIKKHQIEPLQLLKYKQGQKYNHHYDAFKKFNKEQGQRTETLFVYLNDNFEGGETDFPIIKKKIKPKKGYAIRWKNIDENNNIIKESFHAGLPVISGIKYGLNIWIREHKW